MTFERASIVEARGLVFAYRDTPGSAGPALAGVDLTLRAGQTLALLGPNGAGKSSLMRLIAGRLRPAAGSVQVCGGNPHLDRSARSGIGWVPQEIALYPRLTVAENLDIFARLAGLPQTERKRTLPILLDTTGIAHVAGRIVGTLSGGYQRRVNIAASLVAEPQLILLDEPTQGVDLEARDAIHALLLRLRAAGAAILLSTHDFAEAERLADHVAILRDGRLLREGPLRTLLNPFADAPPEQEVRLPVLPDARTRTLLVRRGFSSIGDPLIWQASHGDADRLDGAALLDALRADGLEIAELRLRRPGLETLYRDTLAPLPVNRSVVRSDHAEAVS